MRGGQPSPSMSQTRALRELCSLVLAILRSPSPALAPPAVEERRREAVVVSPRAGRASVGAQVSPAGMAALMLGASMAMMLCGSLTFVIGFFLMPWILGLVMLFYVVGVVCGIGRLLVSPEPAAAVAAATPSSRLVGSPKKERSCE